MDATTTEAQLSVRAPPVVMSSLLLVLWQRERRDLLGVVYAQWVQRKKDLLVTGLLRQVRHYKAAILSYHR